MRGLFPIGLAALAILGGHYVIAQSLPSSLNPGTSAPTGVSDLSNTVGGVVSASVDTSVQFAVSASVGASVNSSNSSAGSEGRSSSDLSSLMVNPGQGSSAARRSTTGSLSRRYNYLLARAQRYGNAAEVSAMAKNSYGARVTLMSATSGYAQTLHSWYESHFPAGGREGETVSPTTNSEAVIYTEDFPDSTKGTALISPPDLGTQSPLDWAPGGLNFGFADFQQTEFLNPTLQVAARHHLRRGTGQGQGANTGNGAAKGSSTSPFSALPSTLTPGLSANPLLTNGLGQSLLQSPLDQSLDQSLGPQP